MKLMRKYSPYLTIPIFAVIGAVLFFHLFARVDFRLEALQAGIDIHPSSKGYTVLRVPPVGEIKASTHRTPLSINISLENVDIDRLKQMIADGTARDGMMDAARGAVTAAVRRLAMLSLALGFGGGVFGLLIIRRKSLRELFLGGLIGLVTLAALLYGTYSTYDVRKFSHPEYEGMIKAAPWMIGLAEESFATVNTWSRQMQGMADNLYGLFRRVESLQAMAPGDGELKVLHVSDIHNNPASFAFIDQFVKTFGVDFIIDSGDMSDLGTPLEAALPERIKNIGVPYVFIPGNHETPSVIRELKKVPNVTILDAGIRAIDGLRVAGIADPSSMTNDFKVSSHAQMDSFAARLRSIIDEGGPTPDVVVAHNPKIAGQFWGRAPVVLSGHDHQYKIREKEHSVFIDAGTSGASGIGAFKTREEIPYTFVLLHFDRVKNGFRLKYTDTISISNHQTGYSMERKIYPEIYSGAPGIPPFNVKTSFNPESLLK